MQRSETVGQAREQDLGLDLRPPLRLDLWALLLATGIVAATVAPLLAAILLLTSFIVSVAVAARSGLVPDEWRAMAFLSPLFVAAGAGIAFLHTTAFDPLLELAEVEPGEVVVVGRVVSPPVPTKVGYRADVRVEHLWYEEKEVLRGGGVQVYSGDMRVGVGDRVQTSGELTRPEIKEDGFDYGQYLQTRGVSGVVYAKGVWPAEEERGWVGQVHRRTDAALGYGLRPREGAVVRGMVLGDSSRLPEEVEEAFRRSGITHVLAISGQHVAVLAAMIYVVLRSSPCRCSSATRPRSASCGCTSSSRAPRRRPYAPASSRPSSSPPRSSGASSLLSTVRTDNTPKVRFSATLGEEPEVEVGLV